MSAVVSLGRLVGAHGTRGELRVRLHNPDSTTLDDLDAVTVQGLTEPVRIVARRRHGRVWLVRLEDVTSREEALALVGREILAAESELAPLADGEFYHYQLVGLGAVDEAGEPIGTVREVMAAPGRDILVIDGPEGECLVPIVDEFVCAVDLGARRIVIRPIPGMLGPVD